MTKKINLLQIDYSSPQPIYMQLISQIKSAILQGEWLAGEAIPTERDLAKSLGISRGTVRKALQELITEGLIIQAQGSGTFIAPKLVPSLLTLQSFNEIAKTQDYQPQHHVLTNMTRVPTAIEAQVLGIALTRDICEIVRVQSINQVVVSLQKAVLSLPDSYINMADQTSLYQYLDAIGYTVAYATQSFRGAVADDYLASHLHVAIGTPLLFVIRKGFTQQNVAIEYTYSWYINDYCDFTIELKTDTAHFH